MAFSIIEKNRILKVLPFDKITVTKANVNVFVSVVFFRELPSWVSGGRELVHTEEKETLKANLTLLTKVFLKLKHAVSWRCTHHDVIDNEMSWLPT